MVKLSPFSVFLLLLISLGMGLLVPGILLRLETIPSPNPLIGINLCPSTSSLDSLQSSSTSSVTLLTTHYIPCQSNATLKRMDDLTIPLPHGMLVSELSYVPVVLIPVQDPPIAGSISLELWHSDQMLFSFSQPLLPLGDEDRTKLVHLHPSHTFSPNSSFPVYRSVSLTTLNQTLTNLTFTPTAPESKLPPSVLAPLQAPAQASAMEINNGLSYHTLSHTLSELIITQAHFVAPLRDTSSASSADSRIPTSEEAAPFLYSYATNLTLKVKDLALFVSELQSGEVSNNVTETNLSVPQDAPDLLISFRQFGLSSTQAEGVYYIIRGGVILVVALALAPAKYWHTGRKLKSS